MDGRAGVVHNCRAVRPRSVSIRPWFAATAMHRPAAGSSEPSNHCEADESGFPRITWDAMLHMAPRVAFG
jgi:hypothetical protein